MQRVQEVMRDVEKPVELPQAFYSLSILTPKVEAGRCTFKYHMQHYGDRPGVLPK